MFKFFLLYLGTTPNHRNLNSEIEIPSYSISFVASQKPRPKEKHENLAMLPFRRKESHVLNIEGLRTGKERRNKLGKEVRLSFSTEFGKVLRFFSDPKPSFVSMSAQPSSREATSSWRGICSTSREDRAKEESSHCHGQKHPWVLPAPLTLQREGCCLSQCRCEHSSHCLENWTLEAGAASCSVMGSSALQVQAIPSIFTCSPFQQCAQHPAAAPSFQRFAVSHVICL